MFSGVPGMTFIAERPGVKTPSEKYFLKYFNNIDPVRGIP
jgi:hypothetical protein